MKAGTIIIKRRLLPRVAALAVVAVMVIGIIAIAGSDLSVSASGSTEVWHAWENNPIWDLSFSVTNVVRQEGDSPWNTVFYCSAPSTVTLLPDGLAEFGYVYSIWASWGDGAVSVDFVPKYYDYGAALDASSVKYDTEPGESWVLADGTSFTFREPETYRITFEHDDGYEGEFTVIIEGAARPSPSPRPPTVSPTRSVVFVDGEETPFEAYLIGGNNFFKLRDLALAINGTEKQVKIGYDNATKAITMTRGEPYTPVGGELAPGDGTPKRATLNSSINISLDGKPVEITAYLIGGNNFVMLRDVMRLLDVYVGYNNTTRNITLDTSRGYGGG